MESKEPSDDKLTVARNLERRRVSNCHEDKVKTSRDDGTMARLLGDLLHEWRSQDLPRW